MLGCDGESNIAETGLSLMPFYQLSAEQLVPVKL